MKNAIVTGANGFVGTQLVKRLVSDGYGVCAVIKDKYENIAELSELENVQIVYCDISEFDQLYEKISILDFQSAGSILFHLAWIGSSGEKRADYDVQLKNIKYSCDTVRSAARLGCECFVGAGSIMEDECETFVPKDLSIPNINYHYSIAKFTAHMMCKTEAAKYNLRFCWGKISNAYGETDTTQRFINIMLKKMLTNEECNLTKSEQLYDFIYITEVARAFEAIGEHGISNTSYYIGTFDVQPLKNFVKIMHQKSRSHSKINFGAVPFNGIYMDKRYFDASKLKRDTGFESAVSFEEGIEKTIKWMNELNKR